VPDVLDPKRLRTDLDEMKAGIVRRGEDPSALDRAAELEGRQRELTTRRDAIRAEIKRLSAEVRDARREGDDARAQHATEESRRLGDEEKRLAGEVDSVASELQRILLMVPNLPSPDCPDGASPADNVVLHVEGHDSGRYADHHRVPHWEVGAALGILDLERGAKLSGSMFPMFRGAGAVLVRALCQLALDRNADAFEEIRPPTLVRTETMVSTGHLPRFEDDAYHLERDDLWAIPTAEVPLTSLGRDEVLDESDLPVRLMAHTSCFRREAGSAGRDTRGLLRVHEFDKVEILSYATPEQAVKEHAELLVRAEGTLQLLGLAYRVVDLCAGDLGASSARTFDLEVYAPGCDMWLEASSVSWFTDYQARRANVRYRPTTGGGTSFVHTLNGSALAVPRVWAAIVETYRRPDGSVEVPEVLRPYMRGIEAITVP
jgi:seryl-tRNA synthetase